VAVADVDEQPSGTRRPDPGQVHQGGSAGQDQLARVGLDGLGLLVDGLEFDDQVDREPASGLADEVAGPDGGDHRPGLG
jgi:hypothetical protein